MVVVVGRRRMKMEGEERSGRSRVDERDFVLRKIENRKRHYMERHMGRHYRT